MADSTDSPGRSVPRPKVTPVSPTIATHATSASSSTSTSSRDKTPSSPTTPGRPSLSPSTPARPLPTTSEPSEPSEPLAPSGLSRPSEPNPPPVPGIDPIAPPITSAPAPVPVPGPPVDPTAEEVDGVPFPVAALQPTPKKTVAAPSVVSNPFNVDLVLPFDIHDAKTNSDQITAAYNHLVNALDNEGGLRVTTRPGRGAKGAEELWVFIGITDGKVAELVARERTRDQAHGMRVESETSDVVSAATRLRLLYELLTSPILQYGLGITPGEDEWTRVKDIVALHDDGQDAAWVHRWTTGGDWKLGLVRGLDDSHGDMLGRNQSPEVRLYFNFLSDYTLSLMPITFVALLFWLFTPADTYPPAFAFCLSLYGCAWPAVWNIRQRKLAVRWGTRGCEERAVQLRPQYVKSHNLRAVSQTHTRSDLIRDAKVIFSIPIILGCGFLLACVLMGIFLLEAFVGHLWTGPGKAVLPYIPMALFSLVVPQIVTLFNGISAKLVSWEDHRTYTGSQKSLTAKSFAMNTIIAYLGLFLTSYVYLPFGPYLMAHVHNLINKDPDAKGGAPHSHHERINVGRLKGQIFAYMVTNQVINTFLEVGLPYILRFINDWREGKVSLKDLKGHDEKTRTPDEDPESRFLDKVAHELTLPPYNIFTDYAEMVTQFGYVVIWGLVWPLAPLFALINNYFELRSDAIKICKHVRRPIGGRVESIGTWLDTMGILAWVGAWTSATLVYLFRPTPGVSQLTLAAHLASYDRRPSKATVYPQIFPVVLAALAASHGYFILRAAVTALAERILWRGSPEQIEVDGGSHAAEREAQVRAAIIREKSLFARSPAEHVVPDQFWNGTAEGVDEIRRVAKSE